MSGQTNKPMMGIVYDSLSGAYALTYYEEEFDEAAWYKVDFSGSVIDAPILPPATRDLGLVDSPRKVQLKIEDISGNVYDKTLEVAYKDISTHSNVELDDNDIALVRKPLSKYYDIDADFNLEISGMPRLYYAIQTYKFGALRLSKKDNPLLWKGEVYVPWKPYFNDIEEEIGRAHV